MTAAKTRVYALIVLLAYLPTVFVASLHTHRPGNDISIQCVDCVNHNPHAGHLTDALSAHSCLLCVFIQQTYIQKDTQIFQYIPLRWQNLLSPGISKWQSTTYSHIPARAPPLFL